MSNTHAFDAAAALQLGQEVLTQEAGALTHLASTLGSEFTDAVSRILSCKGRLIVSGVGKSGHIGRKLAATFASTGTPAYFVHAAEAAHGDLGMITADDVVLAISYSGETNELLTIVPTLKREGATLIAITGNPNSSLAQHADVHLNCHVSREACPLNLAPTTSTTATLALGDALAVATLSAKGFTKEDFARSHPGGALGRRLLIHVQDIMRTGEDIPAVREEVGVLEAVREITKKHIGMTAVVDDQGARDRHLHRRRPAPPHRASRRHPSVRHEGRDDPQSEDHPRPRARRLRRQAPRHLPLQPASRRRRGQQAHRRPAPARPDGCQGPLIHFSGDPT